MKNSFIKKIFIRGSIETLSGLHISSFNPSYSLGILDYSIVRDPITHKPFIPASSIKGKTRFLLEQWQNTDSDESNAIIESLFGKSSKHSSVNPSRIIFRDAYLSEKSAKAILPFEDLPFTELKKEAYINRNTGVAQPTLVERVPTGIFFNFEIILNIYENDQENKFIETVFLGLNMLQDDYLGGRGSRGYGAVKIHITKLTFKDKQHYMGGSSESNYENSPVPESLQ